MHVLHLCYRNIPISFNVCKNGLNLLSLFLLFIQAIYGYTALHNTSHFCMSMVKYEYHRC